jgi:Ca2+-binding RTX toxin-like protein
LGNDILRGGNGLDTAVFSDHGGAWFVDLNAGTATTDYFESAQSAFGVPLPPFFYPVHEQDQLFDIENVTGGKFGDQIIGNAQNNQIFGRDGDDVISGNNGVDRLFGEAGNDTINGGAGSDTVSGGAGNDTIHGDHGNDVIDGGNGDDTIHGGRFNDEINGGAGTDRLYGDEGADQFVFIAGNQLDVVYDYEDGVDSIILFGLFQDLQISVYQQTDVEISDGEGTRMVLRDTDIADITVDDFLELIK